MSKIKSEYLKSSTIAALIDEFITKKKLDGVSSSTIRNYEYFLCKLHRDEKISNEWYKNIYYQLGIIIL